jgi:hypothetical protein
MMVMPATMTPAQSRLEMRLGFTCLADSKSLAEVDSGGVDGGMGLWTGPPHRGHTAGLALA